MSAPNRLLSTSLRGLVLVPAVGALLFPAWVRAQDGLFLTWNDCAQSVAASSGITSSCQTSSGEQMLYAAFRLGQAVDSVIAVEITIDIQHQSAVLPPWWQLAPGGCRYGALSADADFTAHSDCADFWAGMATSSPPVSYYVGEPRGGADQARILVSIALPPTSFRELQAGPMYYAVSLALSNALTSTCTGCEGGACLVLNQILIGRVRPGSGYRLTTPGPLDANWALWQAGGASECAAVPVRRHTWGVLKALYR